MRVLHLANDYSGSSVYKNLCIAIDREKISQFIYVAVRSDLLFNKNFLRFKETDSVIFYRKVLNQYCRLNFRYKINRILKDLLSQINLESVDVIHAHTWYSDGAVAYELFKRYNIPYIVTVRNTDLNLFVKYMLHLRRYGIEILCHARQIVFITPVYYKRFFNLSYLSPYKEQIKIKAIIIPNGIEDFWIQNVSERKSSTTDVLRLIYVGRFLKSKNLFRLIESVKRLNQQKYLCHLTLVGGGGNVHDKVLHLIEGDSSFTFCGVISDKLILKELYQKSDVFTMPSKSETFGLVYVEALSQGLPIVFTKNEGVDWLFKLNVGEAVDCLSVDKIIEAIKKIGDNYRNYNFDPQEIVSNHNWSNISIKYINLYKEVTE